MSRSYNQLNTARQLLERYRSEEPFHLYLKKYFATNRKHGSADRRMLRDLCYAYFRIGHLWKEMQTEERILSAYYLVHPDPLPFIHPIRPDWPIPTSEDPTVRAQQLGLAFQEKSIFPFWGELADAIDARAFAASHLKQPDLFIRIRPGRREKVIRSLQQNEVPYRLIGTDAIAVENTTSLESRFQLDEEVVVQDLSSQRVAECFKRLPSRSHWKVWDACAASGGKSILLNDHLSSVELTCTDVRSSILKNLSNRLGSAGVPVMRIQTDDLTIRKDRADFGLFDLIMADVPCTGSGTWARTPEHLYYFDRRSIQEFVTRQRKILTNLLPQLSSEGYLLYITCSVFEKENTDQVNWLQQTHGLELVAQKNIEGYLSRADSMYAALLRRSI